MRGFRLAPQDPAESCGKVRGELSDRAHTGGRTYTQDEVRDLLAQHDARYRRELEAFTEQLDPLLFQLDALVAEVRALAEGRR